MSKRTTPAKSAAAKRAAFAGQRQQFAASGRAKAYGPTVREKRVAIRIRDDLAQMGLECGGHICGHWIAI